MLFLALWLDEKIAMYIPEEIRKCVAYIEYEDDLGPHLAGTAFFVTRTCSNHPRQEFRYAVTAKHVIEEIEAALVCHSVCLRINLRNGGVARLVTQTADWCFHPDENIDVAVMPITSSYENLDCFFWPLNGFVTNENMKQYELQVGDDVVLVGLFGKHPGQAKNSPIIRTGIVCAMPEELVECQGRKFEAYLIELRSINGLSGSPVFVRPESNYVRSIATTDPYTLGQWGGNANRFWLLGLIHGHWDGDASHVDMDLGKQKNPQKINTGIGIVVPAQKILETIIQPKLEDLRKNAKTD